MAILKNLIDETTNIKNELVICHTNLKNNLINKGVECSNTDKILSLINKISTISTGRKWAKGNAISSRTGFGSITVSGLDFKPSIIFTSLTPPKWSGDSKVLGCWCKDLTVDSKGRDIFMQSAGKYYSIDDKSIYFGGFSLEVGYGSAHNNQSVEWLAVE